VLRWLREAIDTQEIVQEELEQILLLDTELSTEIDAKALLQEITSEELAERVSRRSTTRWIETFEKLSNWLLKKNKQPEAQRHHLLALLADERLIAAGSTEARIGAKIEAKIEATKRLLDLIPQLNQTATQSFSIPDLRNLLGLTMRTRFSILSKEQGIPCALEDEKSEEFVEILGLFEISLQENRASGDLQRQYHNLRWIAGLCYGPAVKLQPLSLYRFFDSFYTAEAIAQKHVQSWTGLTGRSKVHKMLLATELANKGDLTFQGILICINYPPSDEREGDCRIWQLIQNMKSRCSGWLMYANTLAPKQTGLRTLERISSSEWVPLVTFDDLRFIANDSCSDVVFVDWSGKLDSAGSNPLILVTCHQGCAPNISTTKKSWKEIHDVIDKFVSLETEGLKGKDADDLLKQLQPLVQPLAHLTKPGQTLVFCPSGNLHRIPLHALELDGDVLIRRNPIVYCSSLTALKAALQSRKRYESRRAPISRDSRDVGKHWKASLFGKPQSEQGIEALQSLSDKLKVQPFMGDSFTASNFCSEVSSGSDLLHFHGHGEFKDEDPSKQCLLFDFGESLTVDNIYDLSPAPRPYHATLLACGSGMSRTSLSNDVIGLVPAFLYSGAASTVSTLWKFDDKDAALFSDFFYSSFNMSLSGEDEIRVDLAKALQAAVLAIRERNPALYHWAPFVLHGYWMFKVGSSNSCSENLTVSGQLRRGGDGESSIKEECEKVLGDNLDNSTLLLQDQGKYKEAEEMGRRVLNEKEKVLGNEHPETLKSVNILAITLRSQGKYAEAEAMLRQALEGLEMIVGNQHPLTLTTRGRLALVLQDQCRYREAEAVNQQVLEGSEKVLGMDHPDTLASINNQALVLQKLGKYEDAETIYRQLLQRYEKVLGKDHAHTLMIISNLATVLQYQGEYEEAEVLHREALKRREKILGMDHPDTLTSVYNLAFVLHQMKRYDDSSELYQRASNAFEMALGQSHPATIACNNHYNSLKQEMSSNSNAIQPQQNVGS
jgi:CHAT domain-containing protein